MQPELLLKGPYEPRKASRRLRERLVQYLTSHAPRVGAPFFSDNQLIEMSGLSRKAVRAAMEQLQREGWIERHTGRGSFVGPRVQFSLRSPGAGTDARPTIRLAVLAFGMIEDETPDWYSQEVLAGIDQDALEHGICIELMGSHTADMSVLAQRLSQSRPDALVVMPSTSRHALVVGEAQRLDIPCILTGTRLLDLGLPTVCEDGAQGAALAVRHLYERGHRRIGLVQRADAAPWVFHRREGYVRGLTECGIEPDERLVTWLDMPPGPAAADRLMSYLQQQQPTAVVLGSAWHARTLGLLVRDGRIRIPQDLSVVSFDQMIEGYRLHLGFVPTIVELPLRAIGRHVARLAREIVEGKSVRPITSLPCSLSEGESVGGV